MAKGIVKLKTETYSIEIDGINESDEVGYGEPAQVEVNGVLYCSLVDLEGEGDDAEPTDLIGDAWIYVGLAGVETEEEDDEDGPESDDEPPAS